MLEAISPLGGFDKTINDVRIREITGFGLVSLAVPLGGQKAFETAVRKLSGCALPDPGHFARNAGKTNLLIWTMADQFFLLTDSDEPMQEIGLRARLKTAAHVADQSDGWVILEVSGNRAIGALERICPIDLHRDVFTEGSAARTVMEHLGVMILRVSKDGWWLMSARSSSYSFLHAIEQSAKNL